jgi:hypothetical protein
MSEQDLREFLSREAALAPSRGRAQVDLLQGTLLAIRRRRTRMVKGIVIVAVIMTAAAGLIMRSIVDVRGPDGATGAAHAPQMPISANNVAVSINGRRVEGGGPEFVLAHLGVGDSTPMSVSMDHLPTLAVSSATVLVFSPGANEFSPVSDAVAEIEIPKGGGTGTGNFTASHPGRYLVIWRVLTYGEGVSGNQGIASTSDSSRSQGGSLLVVVLGTVVVD